MSGLINLNIILVENSKKHYHLFYIIDDNLLIDPTYNGLQFYKCSFKNLSKFKQLLDDYKIIDNVIIEVDETKRKTFLKPYFYNCISFGKLITGIKGIFFNCKSFINKIKKENGKSFKINQQSF